MELRETKDICAFCRTPTSSSGKESIQRVKNLMKKGNAEAFDQLAGYYDDGLKGMPVDHQKANELFLKAGELGCAAAYYNLGMNYREGRGVEMDKKKCKHYYELAAMMGDVDARYNIGCIDYNSGNKGRAYKHWMIGAKSGDELCLDKVKDGFMKGVVTKDEYAIALRTYQKSNNEMRSDARDKAAAQNQVQR